MSTATMSTAIKRARDRLSDLIDRDGSAVEVTISMGQFGEHLDNARYAQWRTSALTIIRNLASNSHFDQQFVKYDEVARMDHPERFRNQIGILRALLDDLDGGHLESIPALVRGEVFADFLEQAQYLHAEGFWQPATVVAGAVLEDHLRKLCAKHGVALSAKPKLDTMNADLAKAGAYDLLMQKRITALAHVRNKAAHGEWKALTAKDAEDLIRDVLRIVTDHPA